MERENGCGENRSREKEEDVKRRRKMGTDLRRPRKERKNIYHKKDRKTENIKE